jgi:hypothetical protein
MRRYLVILISLLFLLIPATATAAYLNRIDAEADIILYEEEYWEPQNLHIMLDGCHRYTATRISCLAKWQVGEYSYRARDYVHIHHGKEVVEPAGFEPLLVGESGTETVSTRF